MLLLLLGTLSVYYGKATTTNQNKVLQLNYCEKRLMCIGHRVSVHDHSSNFPTANSKSVFNIESVPQTFLTNPSKLIGFTYAKCIEFEEINFFVVYRLTRHQIFALRTCKRDGKGLHAVSYLR